MKTFVALSSVVASLAIVSAASAGLVLTQSDSASPAVYANGGGAGFGGRLGGGSISMDVVGSNLVIGFVTNGGGGSDLVSLLLDTRAGGFADSQMQDTQDGGRLVVSAFAVNVNDTFPTGMNNGLPDFGIAHGGFGTVAFELNQGNTPNHLPFVAFLGGTSVSIPLATLGNPTIIDFFAGLTSETGFNSNETLPSDSAVNGGGNGGFDIATTYSNYNRFVIPEPSTLVALAGVAVTMLRRK